MKVLFPAASMSIADKKLFQGYFGAPYTNWILVQRMDSNDNIVVCICWAQTPWQFYLCITFFKPFL